MGTATRIAIRLARYYLQLLVWSLAERVALTAFPAAAAITCAATNSRLVAAGDESGRFYLFELRGVPRAGPAERPRMPWWRFGRS